MNENRLVSNLRNRVAIRSIDDGTTAAVQCLHTKAGPMTAPFRAVQF